MEAETVDRRRPRIDRGIGADAAVERVVAAMAGEHVIPADARQMIVGRAPLRKSACPVPSISCATANVSVGAKDIPAANGSVKSTW